MKALTFLKQPAQQVYVATGLTRKLLVTDDGMVTVRPTWWAWWTMGARRREGRPRQVTFPLWAIRGGYLRTASWWRAGLLRLDVPTANDPWRRRSNKMREQRTFPDEKPHKIRFNRRQQPWFMYAAEQIGLDK